jgi:catechol 2,3-dioxygenase-like lactoylglutathione lyase family enzyme
MEFKGICIITNNVPRLVDFYSKALCVKAEGDDVHSVLGEVNLAIWNPNAMEPNAIWQPYAIDENKFKTSERFFTLMFEVENVDNEYKRLKHLDIQIEFISQPTTHPWGNRAFGFKDPDGNKIDFFSPIKK